MILGYVRVSSLDQNPQRQLDIMEKYNVEKIFSEKVSGKNLDRLELTNLLEFAREGDIIIISELSRLARNTKDLLNIIDYLENKNIKLVSAKENINTNTATGKLFISLIAVINEFERTNLLERQREGIEIAKRKGKYKGRKKIDTPSNWNEVIDNWKNRKITSKQAMELTGLKKTTFYKKLKEYKNKN